MICYCTQLVCRKIPKRKVLNVHLMPYPFLTLYFAREHAGCAANFNNNFYFDINWSLSVRYVPSVHLQTKPFYKLSDMYKLHVISKYVRNNPLGSCIFFFLRTLYDLRLMYSFMFNPNLDWLVLQLVLHQ